MEDKQLRRGEWGFPPAFLDGAGISAGDVFVCVVNGPSMAPDLLSGDRVVIDTADRHVAEDGIFAVYDAETGSVLVKHVSPVRSTMPPRIVCSSSNPKYAPVEIVLDRGSKVIGRVRYRLTTV